MGRSVTVQQHQERQPRHHRQHRQHRSSRGASSHTTTTLSPSSSSPSSYRQYVSGGSRSTVTTSTQPTDGHHHHHHHHGEPSASSASSASITSSHHHLYEDIERQAEKAAQPTMTAGSGASLGEGSPAGASNVTIQLLTQLRHRSTELESQLATSARQQERLESQLEEATGGYGSVKTLLEAFQELEAENEQLRRRLEYSAASTTLADVQAQARSNLVALDEYRALTEIV